MAEMYQNTMVKVTGERLEVSSGLVLLIDQFMLANKQFVEPFGKILAENLSSGSGSIGPMTTSVATQNRAISLTETCGNWSDRYGGYLARMSPGSYNVFRDPVERLIWLMAASESDKGNTKRNDEAAAPGEESVLAFRGEIEAQGRVLVDTRCLVFIDLEHLADKKLLAEYCKLREQGTEKQGRDFLRKKGAAVRYGFQRYGDELGVFLVGDDQTLALWPDVIELEAS